MKDRPSVSDIMRECGVMPSELAEVAPDLNIHTLKKVSSGMTSGITQASGVAAGLRVLAGRHRDRATELDVAASLLTTLYPHGPVERDTDETLSGAKAKIVDDARKKSFAAVGRQRGISRERVRQVVEEHEEASGERIPRHRKDR
jgi:hypothetical protein